MLVIICTWKSQRMGTSNLMLMLISWTWGCTTFHNFISMFKRKNQKLAGLWLAGEVVNHVGIYGSKAAEGLSAFQRRSCLEIKRYHTFIVQRSHLCCLCFYILLMALILICTYIVLKASSCVTFSAFFATRASIICIHSGTCDTIRISLPLAIRFFRYFNLSLHPY